MRHESRVRSQAQVLVMLTVCRVGPTSRVLTVPLCHGMFVVASWQFPNSICAHFEVQTRNSSTFFSFFLCGSFFSKFERSLDPIIRSSNALRQYYIIFCSFKSDVSRQVLGTCNSGYVDVIHDANFLWKRGGWNGAGFRPKQYAANTNKRFYHENGWNGEHQTGVPLQ